MDIREYLVRRGYPYDVDKKAIISPITWEKTPSFYITENGKGFKCFSSGEGGNLVKLISILENIPIDQLRVIYKKIEELFEIESVSSIKKLQPANHSSLNNKKKEDRFKITSISNIIKKRYLRDYAKSRGLKDLYIDTWFKEVKYLDTKYNKHFHALGIQNRKNGWVLRSGLKKLGKLNIGKSTYSIKKVGNNNTDIYIYEGMFDAPSFHQMTKREGLYVILNSVHNIKHLIDDLRLNTDPKQFNMHLLLDRDEPANKRVEEFIETFPHAQDRRAWVKKGNDVNEYLMELKGLNSKAVPQ
jgi:hypothetical protein